MTHQNGFRNLVATGALSLSSFGSAQWTTVNLHPANAVESGLTSVAGGRQVGYSLIGEAYRASLWTGTAASWVDLTPSWASQSVGRAASLSQQVGESYGSSGPRATLWNGSASAWIDLNPLGSYGSECHGADEGSQVGWASFLNAPNQHAAVWSGTTESCVDLNPLLASSSGAFGVGDGQQVGWATVGAQSRASLWRGTSSSWVDLSPVGAIGSTAWSTSSGKQVGDIAFNSGGSRASIWSGSAGSWVSIHPALASGSVARSIYRGCQAGTAVVGGHNRASFWRGTAASWVDLHALLSSTYAESEAFGVWHDENATYVVGKAYHRSNARDEAVMWIGPPQPPKEFWVVLEKSKIAGQATFVGEIWLGRTQETATVFSVYDNSSLVATPGSATIAAGQRSTSFPVSVTAITGTVVTTI
ncbi:MAG: hypothetical protein ABL962_16920, partial [Fimbriimonadaceae bacterium]